MSFYYIATRLSMDLIHFIHRYTCNLFVDFQSLLYEYLYIVRDYYTVFIDLGNFASVLTENPAGFFWYLYFVYHTVH